MNDSAEPTHTFALSDMEFHVQAGDGSEFGIPFYERLRQKGKHVEVYRRRPGDEAWCHVPMRLTLGGRLTDFFLDSTWVPLYSINMAPRPDGFMFEFWTNYWDPPDRLFRAIYSSRSRGFTLTRLAKSEEPTWEQLAQARELREKRRG